MASDSQALQRLAEALEELARVPSQASTEAAQKLEMLLKAQFDEGVDPYGKPWAPTAKGGHSSLYAAGDLRDSISVRPMAGAGIQITVDSPYASFHQAGTRNMAARKILPDRGLPTAWSDAIEEAIEAAVLRRLERER